MGAADQGSGGCPVGAPCSVCLVLLASAQGDFPRARQILSGSVYLRSYGGWSLSVSTVQVIFMPGGSQGSYQVADVQQQAASMWRMHSVWRGANVSSSWH